MGEYISTMYGKDQFEHRKEQGFDDGNISEDGEYIIGDMGLNKGCLNCNHDLPKPKFLPKIFVDRKGKKRTLGDNHPFYDDEETYFIVHIPESAPGAKDGWRYFMKPGVL